MWVFVWIAVGAVLVAVIAIVVITTLFHTAEAQVTLLEWKSDVTEVYTAGGEASLTYQVVAVSDVATKTVPATGSVQAEDRATGTIVVSNLYSTQPQRLITNTRFETPDGRVYRIHAPITVPGYTTKSGEKVAGTIEATVYADEPGEKYNVDSSDFKLPGLKNTNQYDVITARTKGPLSGGFVGTRATVEKSVRDQAIAELRAELDRKLRERVVAEAPATSVIFPDSISIRYTEAPDKGEGSEALITVNGSAVAPAFNGDPLARELAQKAGISSDAPLRLENAGELSYAAVEASALDGGGAITFNLAGTAHLVAAFDPTELAEDLAGKDESEAQTVRTEYPALIGPMTVSVYPFWLSTLPANPERISVIIKGALDQ